MFGHQPRDFAGPGGRVHAADQEAPAVTGAQQFKCIVDPRCGAREHDDAVSLPVRRGFSYRELIDEPEKSRSE